MTKIRYFVKGALALVVDSLNRERITTRVDQILLYIGGVGLGMTIVLLSYIIFRYIR